MENGFLVLFLKLVLSSALLEKTQSTDDQLNGYNLKVDGTMIFVAKQDIQTFLFDKTLSQPEAYEICFKYLDAKICLLYHIMIQHEFLEKVWRPTKNMSKKDSEKYELLEVGLRIVGLRGVILEFHTKANHLALFELVESFNTASREEFTPYDLSEESGLKKSEKIKWMNSECERLTKMKQMYWDACVLNNRELTEKENVAEKRLSIISAILMKEAILSP